MPKPPKSELTSQSASHILFTDAQENGGSTLSFEANVGQKRFVGSPNGKHDQVVVVIDGEEWFLMKSDAQELHAWLGQALAK